MNVFVCKFVYFFVCVGEYKRVYEGKCSKCRSPYLTLSICFNNVTLLSLSLSKAAMVKIEYKAF